MRDELLLTIVGPVAEFVSTCHCAAGSGYAFLAAGRSGMDVGRLSYLAIYIAGGKGEGRGGSAIVNNT